MLLLLPQVNMSFVVQRNTHAYFSPFLSTYLFLFFFSAKLPQPFLDSVQSLHFLAKYSSALKYDTFYC